MAMNPSEEAHENYKNEVDKLRAEVWFYFYFIEIVVVKFEMFENCF